MLNNLSGFGILYVKQKHIASGFHVRLLTFSFVVICDVFFVLLAKLPNTSLQDFSHTFFILDRKIRDCQTLMSKLLKSGVENMKISFSCWAIAHSVNSLDRH